MEPLKRLFLADPSWDYLELLRGSLDALPEFLVAGCAARGDDVCAALAESSVDLLVTDLLLPGLDGLSMITRLKERNALPKTVVVSAFYNSNIVQSVSLLGVSDFIRKPCAMQILIRRIRAAAMGGIQIPPARLDPLISTALSRFGIPPHLNGRRYLEEALRRSLAEPDVLRGITKILYPDLAKHFGTTPVCIERSIRAAIQKGWARCPHERRRLFFGSLFDDFSAAPSNSKFMIALVRFLQEEYARPLDAARFP